MNLDVGFAELDAILDKMGIEKLVPDPQGPTGIDIKLQGKGILVDPGKIKVTDVGPLIVEGRKVLVYIRDQYAALEYKFHVADCLTIQEFKRNNRFNARYVASTRTDGSFWVRKNGAEEQLEKMRVCKNCLERLDYENYNQKWGRDQQKIYADFSLEKFFEKYGKTQVSHPKHTDVTSTKNVYSSHQRIFSRICRERARWRCEGCGILLEEPGARKFLHAHHVNGNKSDNRWDNLRALCVECHHEQPGHALSENARQEFREWKKRRGVDRHRPPAADPRRRSPL